MDLIQLIKSNKFNFWKAITYLHECDPEKTGVFSFVCNALYEFGDQDIEFFIPQLCNRVLKDTKADALCRFLMDKCQSLHLALKMFFWFTGAVEDNCFPRERCNYMWNECEMSAVNCASARNSRMAKFSNIKNGKKLNTEEEELSTESETNLHLTDVPQMEDENSEINEEIEEPKTPPIERLQVEVTKKQAREQFFHKQLVFVAALTGVSSMLAKKKGLKSRGELNHLLSTALAELQDNVIDPSIPGVLKNVPQENLEDQWDESSIPGYYLPACNWSDRYYRILNILPAESFTLNSRDRVPFMLYLEVVEISHRDYKSQLNSTLYKSESSEETGLQEALEKMIYINLQKRNMDEPNPEDKCAIEPNFGNWVLMDKSSKKDQAETIMDLAFRELWENRKARIKKNSTYGSLPGWGLRTVIIKSGDDLRQEQLATQLIDTFYRIFKEAELNLWLRPYSVVATSSNTGVVEAIPDTVSLDNLKKRLPNMSNLLDYFQAVYGEKSSIPFIQAQRNFVESLAGYSLVCFLLQIKDRHNGNILIDKNGHIIHIDYGYMLTSSPGSINFETAPFKFTNEFAEVMGGLQSDLFAYFRLLFFRGFLEVRKHYRRILLLVEMLFPGHKMGCFARKEATIKELHDRFHLELDDKECIAFVTTLIRESIGNWRTESYDSYQWWRNGILV